MSTTVTARLANIYAPMLPMTILADRLLEKNEESPPPLPVKVLFGAQAGLVSGITHAYTAKALAASEVPLFQQFIKNQGPYLKAEFGHYRACTALKGMGQGAALALAFVGADMIKKALEKKTQD